VVFLGENEWIIEYGVCVEYPVLEEDTQDCMDERVHNGGKRKVLGTTHDQLVSSKTTPDGAKSLLTWIHAVLSSSDHVGRYLEHSLGR
jgi:hypothetical protein